MDRHYSDAHGHLCLKQYMAELGRRTSAPVAARALRLVADRPSRFVSVGEWADSLGVTREHLTRCFTGVARPHDILISVRLVVAVGALVRRPAGESAAALDTLGFLSRSHAFAVFRTKLGVTPDQYRRRFRADDPSCRICEIAHCPLYPLGCVDG